MPTPIVSLRPFGLGLQKPRHYRDMLRVAWENRHAPRQAWRILRHGVCDGCSLGPYGLRDNTIPGVHLCMVRLKLLRLNTMPALDPRLLEDLDSLRALSNRELRRLGRLPYPMLRRRGERGFRRLTWDDGLDCAADALRSTPPDRLAFYTTSRGLTNEVYYVAQKLARFLGTNNIDNAARLCHAASTVAMGQTLGVAAATCSYSDWIGADLIVLFGSDVANNQPVTTKYFYYAKQKGARILVVNPYREPGLENYWIPSITKSALFGTRLLDDFFPVRVGGDVAFLNGVLKILIERDWLDKHFIAEHTAGFEVLKAKLAAQSFEELEASSGLSRADFERFARQCAEAKNAVLIWSMGLTQHRFGVENVKAVVNLALVRGWLGRAHCGLVPIRGHSGVQGAAECGSVPGKFPGGFTANEENARRFAQLWGQQPPAAKGLDAPQMLEAAARGDLDLLYNLGGNFFETMPEPDFVRRAFDRLRFRVHQDIILNSSMLLDSDAVLLLPARTRYEQAGGGTATSTERRIRFNPQVVPHAPGEARSEWEILVALAQRVLPSDIRGGLFYRSADDIRLEMDRVMPLYQGIAQLKKEGDWIQYGGPRLLEDGVCEKLPAARAQFSPLDPPGTTETFPADLARRSEAEILSEPATAGESKDFPTPPHGAPSAPLPTFLLTTRRGSQFNSMLFDPLDPLTGARRDDVLLSPADAARLGLRPGDPIRLRSPAGQLLARARLGDVAPGCLIALWPEANPLIPRRYDPASGEPDYTATVTLEKA